MAIYTDIGANTGVSAYHISVKDGGLIEYTVEGEPASAVTGWDLSILDGRTCDVGAIADDYGPTMIDGHGCMLAVGTRVAGDTIEGYVSVYCVPE